MKLTLVRHTSLKIASGICYGQSDIDVSAQFMQEFEVLEAKIATYQFDAIYTSPLQRCSKLALALNKQAAAQIMHEPLLKELNFGDWEMQAWDDIPRQLFDTWSQNYGYLSPPNGETFAQLQQRGIAFLNHLNHTHPQQHILAVTHGGIIRALIAHVLNLPLRGLFRFEIDYTSLTQLDFTGNIPKISFVNR